MLRLISSALLLTLTMIGWAQEAGTGHQGGRTAITFVGDVLLDRGVRERIDTAGIDAVFSPSVDSLFAASHLVVANLECPATHVHAPMQKKYIFRADPEHLDALHRHGITHLNLANNHSIDQGRRGLLSTCDNIRQAGMVPVGAGKNMSEAAQPVLLADGARRVWLLTSLRLALENYAYLPGKPCVSQESFDSLVARVASLRGSSPSDYIIVTLHWGGENTMRPILQQVVDAHRLVDAGANLIVGHHSHTLQPSEQYHGATIFYSIRNFIFDAHRDIHKSGCAVTVTVTADSAEVTSRQVTIKECTPYLIGRLGDWSMNGPTMNYEFIALSPLFPPSPFALSADIRG